MNNTIYLQKLTPSDFASLREMLWDYWQELMPKSDIVRDEQRREDYFQRRFIQAGEEMQLYEAHLDSRRLGFVNVSLSLHERKVTIEDFYVFPEVRRQGHGSAIIRQLMKLFDKQGIERIDWMCSDYRGSTAGAGAGRSDGFYSGQDRSQGYVPLSG